MEIQVIEEKKNKIVFELDGTTHTFCNLLKQELTINPMAYIRAYSSCR